MNESLDLRTNGSAAADTRSQLPSLGERVRSLRLPSSVTADRPRGSSRRVWMLGALLACAALASGLYANRRSAAPPSAPPRPAISTVDAAPLRVGDVVLESKGYLIAAHQIQVSPKVGGLVVHLDFEEGRRVEKGQILCRLETVDYQAERDRARGKLDAARERFLELNNGFRPEEIKQAKAELDEAEATRKQLYLDWERNKQLNGQALAERERESAEGAFRAADRRLEHKRLAYRLMVEGPRREKVQAARAEVVAAEADLTKAQWRLDNCTIRAPLSGTILTKKAEEGNVINPSAYSNGLSASLCDLADLSDLEVELKIAERDVAKVVRGQPCRIRCEAFPERVYEGVVARLMPIADRSQAALPIRVKVKVPPSEEGVYLRPEMGAIVSFLK